jgi:hypothetical protein
VKKDPEFHHRGAEGAEGEEGFMKSLSPLCVSAVILSLDPSVAALPLWVS